MLNCIILYCCCANIYFLPHYCDLKNDYGCFLIFLISGNEEQNIHRLSHATTHSSGKMPPHNMNRRACYFREHGTMSIIPWVANLKHMRRSLRITIITFEKLVILSRQPNGLFLHKFYHGMNKLPR